MTVIQCNCTTRSVQEPPRTVIGLYSVVLTVHGVCGILTVRDTSSLVPVASRYCCHYGRARTRQSGRVLPRSVPDEDRHLVNEGRKNESPDNSPAMCTLPVGDTIKCTRTQSYTHTRTHARTQREDTHLTHTHAHNAHTRTYTEEYTHKHTHKRTHTHIH